MDIILPYERELEESPAFIKPNGEILFGDSHAWFAYYYCFGQNYDDLLEIKSGRSYDPYYTFEDYKREHNYQGRQEDIDVFESSHLTEEELELFKKCFYDNDFFDYYTFVDFLVYVSHFDMVIPLTRHIVTIDLEPHIRFYNYYLMDWEIQREVPKEVRFDEKRNRLALIGTGADVTQRDYDFKAEIEVEKSKFLRKDRYLCFK